MTPGRSLDGSSDRKAGAKCVRRLTEREVVITVCVFKRYGRSKGGDLVAPIVKTRIVRIGNSQGIRIPKILLEQTSLGEEIELEVREGEIIVRAAQRVRNGWEAAFKAMSERGDDELLDGEVSLSDTWDEEEWEW